MASDLTAFFAAIPAGTTARALALALSPIIGGVAAVTSHGDYSEITFTPEQEERLSAWILTQLNREPGPVRIDSGGVATKVIMRQYWPYMLGFVAAGALVGYAVSKGGR